MDPVKADDVVTAKNVDLSTCDRELVQYPEAIQPHGAMLTVDDQSHLILHASANCAEFLGKPPEAVVGSTIAAVLGPAWRDLTATLHRMPLDSGPVNIARESFVGTERGFNLFAHRCGGLIILELEKSAADGSSASAQSLFGGAGRPGTAARRQRPEGFLRPRGRSDSRLHRLRPGDGLPLRRGRQRSRHRRGQARRPRGLSRAALSRDRHPGSGAAAFFAELGATFAGRRLHPGAVDRGEKPSGPRPGGHELRQPAQRLGDVHRLPQEHGRAFDPGDAAGQGGQAVGADLGHASCGAAAHHARDPHGGRIPGTYAVSADVRQGGRRAVRPDHGDEGHIGPADPRSRRRGQRRRRRCAHRMRCNCSRRRSRPAASRSFRIRT